MPIFERDEGGILASPLFLTGFLGFFYNSLIRSEKSDTITLLIEDEK
jgi:hypothetical protein